VRMGDLVLPRAGLVTVEKRKIVHYRESNPCRPLRFRGVEVQLTTVQ
jgi:hypothetical protein